MAWIKRNLFFFIGVILALGMLAAALLYDVVSWNRNSASFDRLNAIYQTLRGLENQKISAGNDKVNNIAAAREQERRLRDWMNQTGKFFQPIAPVPDMPDVTGEAFANALRHTIYQLQQEAAAASVALPPDCAFSFTAERINMQFSPGSLRPLSEQLGEVKTISEILFAAHINSLVGIQRVRVSGTDAGAQQSDYLDEQPVTGNLATLTPYQITFCGFSSEIAQVLSSFAMSPHGFIVKGINVQPAGSAAARPPPRATPPTATSGKGGLQTVLDEQLLRITLVVEVVKLSPGR
jgi:hypothetical protein